MRWLQSSVALLEGLGVWASVDQQRVCAVEHMRVFGDDGPQLAFDAYGATVERLATIVEESELLRVLDAACGFQPSIKRVFSSFTSLAAQPDVIDVASREALDCSEAVDWCRRCELFGACGGRNQCGREVVRANGHRCELRMRAAAFEYRVAMVYRSGGRCSAAAAWRARVAGLVGAGRAGVRVGCAKPRSICESGH